MVVEPLRDVPAAFPEAPGPWRLGDYLGLPDEPRCELLYGELIVAPSPRSEHQAAVAALHLQLAAFRDRAGGRVWTAPLDVVLADHTVVQPDLCWTSLDRRDRVGSRVEGAPDLVVEVLSPGSLRRDRVWKLELYRRSDVRELWLVEPEAAAIDFLLPGREGFELRTLASGVYRSPAIPDLTLDLDELWHAAARWEPLG
jgi:Uma2 family endonuclease